jgi:multidrug efflux pump subunit AcrB
MLRTACLALALGLPLAPLACSRDATRPAARSHDAGAPAPPAPEEVLVAVSLRAPLDPAMAESKVTRPIEDALARLRGVVELRSLTTENEVRLTCRLAAGADGHEAARDVSGALRDLAATLPPTAATPRVTRRPPVQVLRWTAASPTWTRAEMTSVAAELIRPALERVSGVVEVGMCGSSEPVVRVAVDLDRLAALGLDLAALAAALARPSPFASLEDVAAAPMTLPTGMARARDVAQVERGESEPACTARLGDGAPVLSIEVAIDSSAPVEYASRRVREAIAQVAAQLPAGAVLTPFAAGQELLELRADAPPGTSAEQLAQFATAMAGQLAGAGVDAVLVESGSPPGATDRLDLPGVRALVAVGKAGADAALAAASKTTGVRVRVASGRLAALPILLRGSEVDQLERAAEAAVAALDGLPGMAGAAASRLGIAPRVDVAPDADKLAAHGLAAADIARAVQIGLTGEVVAELRERGGTIPVRLEPSGPRAGPAEALGRLRLRGTGSAPVPLSSLATISLRAVPAALFRVGRQRAVEVWLQPAPGARDQAVAAARAALVAPAGIEVVWPEPDAPREAAPGQAPSQSPPAEALPGKAP